MTDIDITFTKHCNMLNIQYTYIVGKYRLYLYKLKKQVEKRTFGANKCYI